MAIGPPIETTYPSWAILLGNLESVIINLLPDEPPTWAILAKENLLTRDLGVNWVECVDLWFQIEAKLGYGLLLRTKVSLPQISYDISSQY